MPKMEDLERQLRTRLPRAGRSRLRVQDDLFNFVNAEWVSKTEIPDDEGAWGNINQLHELNQLRLHNIVQSLLHSKNIKAGSAEQKVRDFFLSGMNNNSSKSTGTKELEYWYEQIDKVKDRDELTGLLGRLHLFGVGTPWLFYVDQDEKNSDQYMFRLRQGGLSLPDTDYYLLDSNKMKKIRKKFEAHIPKMMKIIKHKPSGKIGTKLYEFEKNLAQHSMTPIQRRDIKAQYNKYTYSKLKKSFPNIIWASYFKSLGIKPPRVLVVDQPKFFKEINKQFKTSALDEVKEYLKWHTFLVISKCMGDGINRANFEYFGKELRGLKKMKPKWKRVIMLIDQNIGEALGKLYVERYFPLAAKRRMELLVKDVSSAFAERIRDLDWMSPITKKYALKKLNNFNVKIGYPKKLRTYGAVKVAPDSYIKNVISATIAENKRELAKLGRPMDREEWHMTPQTVNAYYSFNFNEIVFPAGILQPPFFDFEADDALNYGGIGYVIGHELTHGFDDKGSEFDAKGNLRDWWSTSDKRKFTAKTKTMVKLANKYESLPGEFVKGELTLGENIADLGGAEIAYQAFQKALKRSGSTAFIEGYTQPERFFLSMAVVWRRKLREQLMRQQLLTDPHAPEEFRVNNTARNMDSFYEVFNTKTTDKLYLPPSSRARIW